jgi:uncharacterized protein DUF5134
MIYAPPGGLYCERSRWGGLVIEPESLRWVLTVAFVVASAYHLARVPRTAGADRVSEAAHLTMGVAMVAMIWPWGGVVPPAAWVGVFTASTGWFVVRALRSAGRRGVLGLFASSMAACAWMGATTPAQASPAHGMPMPVEGAHLTTAGLVSGLLGGYLVVAALWWFARGLRLGGLATTPAPGPRPPSWSALCHGLMSAGMGLALLAMA